MYAPPTAAHEYERPCGAYHYTESRVLVIARVHETETPRKSRLCLPSCDGDSHVISDVLKKSLLWSDLAKCRTVPPPKAELCILRKVEQYLCHWYRSNKWEFQGVITKEGSEGAGLPFVRRSSENQSFALLTRIHYCSSYDYCSHRKEAETRAREEERQRAVRNISARKPPAYRDR